MDSFTAETIDSILADIYALLQQAERVCKTNGAEDYLEKSLKPVVEYMGSIPSAHGDGRHIIYEPIPE